MFCSDLFIFGYALGFVEIFKALILRNSFHVTASNFQLNIFHNDIFM